VISRAPAGPTVKKNPAILRLWLSRRGADPAAVLEALGAHSARPLDDWIEHGLDKVSDRTVLGHDR
jgi:hypothetical protein